MPATQKLAQPWCAPHRTPEAAAILAAQDGRTGCLDLCRRERLSRYACRSTRCATSKMACCACSATSTRTCWTAIRTEKQISDAMGVKLKAAVDALRQELCVRGSRWPVSKTFATASPRSRRPARSPRPCKWWRRRNCAAPRKQRLRRAPIRSAWRWCWQISPAPLPAGMVRRQLLAGTGKDQVHLLVVATAERGLCGGFNSSIVTAGPRTCRQADGRRARR